MTAPLKDFAAAAEWLGVGEHTLRKKVARRQWPHSRVGRHVRFSETDLEAIVALTHVDPGPSAAVAELRARRRKPA
jgi:excisionase family DNA binding protein